MHQLIVIGNGFDLSCDLKSSFSDFHDYRAKSDLVAHPENTTIWDLILKQEKGHNWRWCDVEHQIRRWLYKSGQKDPQMLRLPECVLDPSVKPSQTARTNAVYSYVLSNWLRDRKLDGSVLAALSLADLNRYESYFATYLNDLVQRTPGYLDSAATRMERICRDLVDEDGVPPSTSVLSFNYTEPLSSNVRLSDALGIDCFCNIHGRASDYEHGIVFGIDAKGIRPTSVAIPFTKTYRLLAQDPVDFQRVVRPKSSNGASMGFIKFFGHSLSEADYSYFQSIFDAVDLYGGDTRLVFYYRPHGKKGETEKVMVEKARREVHKNVTKLLAAYGESFDNKDHGKNLMHKLLLEGRLMVRRLP